MDRPTQQLHRWEGVEGVVAGKDLKAGGTWLAVRHGQLAAVTNFRVVPPPSDNQRSRGELPLLAVNQENESFRSLLLQRGALFGPVSLIWGNPQQLFSWSNQRPGILSLQSGVHALSNAFLNTPWVKMEKGKAGLRELIERDLINHSSLFSLLEDTEPTSDELLPKTGLALEQERHLSSIRVPVQGGYGSRSATVVLMRDDGGSEIWEKNYLTDELVQIQDNN